MSDTYIPYGRQDINQIDIEAVCDVLTSDWLTQGPAVLRFEQALCTYTGAKYAAAVSSATAALHVSCLALGLGKDDWLWTSANTYVASANCALYCGAQVDFVDIDPMTYNMSVTALENKLLKAEKLGRLPKIVIPVHFAGQSCDMRSIKLLSEKYGFRIIEDASHAIGGRYLDKPVGSCQYSDITVFSFHPVKVITTGEGGAALSNNADIDAKLKRLRSHGVTRDRELLQRNDGPWYYEQQELGFNYRMSDMQAALGCSQLSRIDEFVTKRHKIAEYYRVKLDGFSITLPFQDKSCYSALHLYPIQVDKTIRKELFEHLRTHQIGVNVHYIPVYKQPYYQNIEFPYDYCLNAEDYYDSILSLPIYYGLKKSQQNCVIEKLASFISDPCLA